MGSCVVGRGAQKKEILMLHNKELINKNENTKQWTEYQNETQNKNGNTK